MFGRVHQYDGILVEHAFVVFNENLQVTFVLEVYPCGAVGQHIGVAGDRYLERSVHTLAARRVPGAAVIFDIDAEVPVPDHEFLDMGARAITPRYEGALIVLNAFATSFKSLMPAGSLFGPISTKSLYMTGMRFTPSPSSTNLFSEDLLCTNTTSASPRLPVSSA